MINVGSVSAMRARIASQMLVALLCMVSLQVSMPLAQVLPDDELAGKNMPLADTGELLDSIEEQFAILAVDRELIKKLQGDRLRAAQFRLDQRTLDLLTTFIRAAEEILKKPTASGDRGELSARLSLYSVKLDDQLKSRLVDLSQRVDRTRLAIESLAGQDRATARAELASIEAQRLHYLELIIDVAQLRRALGFAEGPIEALATQRLKSYSEELVGSVLFSQATRTALEEELARRPEDPDLQAAVAVATTDISRAARRLERVVLQLERLSINTSAERRVLLTQAKGVSVSLVDADVLSTLFADLSARGQRWLQTQALDTLTQLVIFLGIVLLARLLARFARAAANRAFKSRGRKMSVLMRDVLASLMGGTVLTLGVLLAFAQVGISVAPMLAGLGVAGFIIGFALQDTLGNFAAGAMILAYKPFDTGDYIEVAGVAGNVNSMNLVSTTITTVDNQVLIVPNSKIWGDVIRNYTGQRMRRVDTQFSVSYGDDIEKVEQILADVVSQIPTVLPSPETVIRMHRLGESSVDFIVRPWAQTEHYWETYWALQKQVKLRFDAEGISFPFPQRDIHIYNAQD